MASLLTLAFVLLFSICYFIYTITFTYVLGVSRSMKRQLQISDCGIGWLYAAVGLGYAITVTVAAYFGGRGRRERWIGGGFLVVALGCLILVISAFVAPRPIVERPEDETELWKGAFYPLTEDDISTSANLADSFWGRRLPDNVRADLIEKNYSLSGGKEKRSIRRWTKREVDVLTGAIDHVRGYMGYHDEDEVESTHRLAKRQLPQHQFPDDLRDRMSAKLQGIVVVFMLGWDPYDRFAGEFYNITHDPEIFERMMKAARLPFGYCRNASSIVRSAIKRKECERAIDGSAIGGLVLAFVGFAAIGVGSTTVWTVGAPLLDDHVAKVNLALVLAGVFGLQALGFIIGVVLGLFSEFKFYGNFDPPAGLTPIDPRWVGAWWLGFVIISVSLIIPAALMTFIIDQRRNRNGNRTPPDHQNDQCLMRARVGGENEGRWKGLICSVFRVCRPPIFVALLLALTFDALALKGYFDVLPKYYENNYSPSILKSALPFWLFSIGTVFGGVAFRLARPDGRKAALYMLVCTLLAAVFSLAQSNGSFSCNNVVHRVQEAGLANSNSGRPIWPTCVGCICDPAEFYPVCANDTANTPYYSPCHAGCTNFTYEIVRTSVEFHFDYCFCATAVRMRVSRDTCEDDCASATTGYLILSSLAALLSGSVLVPAVLFLLRTSTFELRSLALGVVGLAVCVFGLLPSALVYRFVADSTCFSWRASCASSAGHKSICEIFDGPLLRERLHLFLGVLRLVSVAFYGLVVYHAKNVKLYLPTSREVVYATELRESELQKPDDVVKVNLMEKP